MPRYIDADELKESLRNLKAKGSNRKYVQGLQDAIDGYFPQIIDDVPTVNVEPVRHGRWIRGKNKSAFPAKHPTIWHCSCCGEMIRYNDSMGAYQKIKKKVNEVNPRCRRCGAKMNEVEE